MVLLFVYFGCMCVIFLVNADETDDRKALDISSSNSYESSYAPTEDMVFQPLSSSQESSLVTPQMEEQEPNVRMISNREPGRDLAYAYMDCEENEEEIRTNIKETVAEGTEIRVPDCSGSFLSTEYEHNRSFSVGNNVGSESPSFSEEEKDDLENDRSREQSFPSFEDLKKRIDNIGLKGMDTKDPFVDDPHIVDTDGEDIGVLEQEEAYNIHTDSDEDYVGDRLYHPNIHQSSI